MMSFLPPCHFDHDVVHVTVIFVNLKLLYFCKPSVLRVVAAPLQVAVLKINIFLLAKTFPVVVTPYWFVAVVEL